MATLSAHIIASIFVFIVGLWQLVSCFKNYLKTPREYTARLWHPLPLRFKQLQLYLQLLAILIAILHQLIISTDFDPLIKGSTPVYHFTTLQTAGTLFVFLLLIVVVLLSENTTILPIPTEAQFLLAAVGFALEWAVLTNGVSLTSGIEGKCEWLLGVSAGICCACAVLLAWQPRLFVADLALGSTLTLQGSWLLQTGLTLYVGGFIPEGCHHLLDVPGGVEGSTRCDLDEFKLRALALLDLLFILHVIFVIIITIIVYGLVAKVLGVKRYGGYEPLSSTLDSNHVQMKGILSKAQA